MIRFVIAISTFTLLAGLAWAEEGKLTSFPAIGPELERLEIKSATDIAAMAPLIADFQTLNPGIVIDYAEFLTNDLDRDADLACAAGLPFGDLIISPQVDQMVKHANDGCAISHVSPETSAIPNTSTYWRDEVFGFTYEPAVIVYNANFVPAEEVPRTRSELADLLRARQDYYLGKVATYDLRLSGLGYLLAFLDSQQTSTAYGRLLESMSQIGVRLRCCTSAILSDVATGKAFLGYNVLGSYAYAAARDNPALRIVLPRDYTLVIHRAALIPRYAAHPDLGARFLDYLLSDRGQSVSIEQSFYFSRDGQIPAGIDGPTTLIASGIGRTVTIRPTLLATQDEGQRQRFIEDWTALMLQTAEP